MVLSHSPNWEERKIKVNDGLDGMSSITFHWIAFSFNQSKQWNQIPLHFIHFHQSNTPLISQLIDQTTHTWKVQLIDDLFNPKYSWFHLAIAYSGRIGQADMSYTIKMKMECLTYITPHFLHSLFKQNGFGRIFGTKAFKN